ncbi:MAG: retropepsin-like domain-containing protein [Dehalococcoidia bacterium]|nr:retropepsin-like domain-containing protein [Dehalococcoidia bacterium]
MAIDVMTADRLSFESVLFKLDTGSEFTTLSSKDLDLLGYTVAFLQSCKVYGNASSAAGNVVLQYIDDVSIKLGDREIQGCRVFFARGSQLHSLFGSDILRYFNYSVNYDTGELQMSLAAKAPKLAQGEPQLHIYSLNQADGDDTAH